MSCIVTGFGDWQEIEANIDAVERVRLCFTLQSQTPPEMPKPRAHDSLITFGLDGDMNRTRVFAVIGMLDWIQALSALRRNEAQGSSFDAISLPPAPAMAC